MQVIYELLLRSKFLRHHRRLPNLRHPKSAQEKVLYRKLYGNHEFYAQFADKLKVRDYVASTVGEQYLIPLYGSYCQLGREDFDKLPNSFALKANHGCKWNRFVQDKRNLDIPATIDYFNSLMKKTYGLKSGEQHYRYIKPQIIAEKLLDVDGKSPWDYCFFSYWCEEKFTTTLSIVSPDRAKYIHFGPEQEILDANVSKREYRSLVSNVDFNEMRDVARQLSRGFDFVRVDLYGHEKNIYFGEMTFTPGAGGRPTGNPIRQELRDKMWIIDVENINLYRSLKAAA